MATYLFRLVRDDGLRQVQLQGAGSLHVGKWDLPRAVPGGRDRTGRAQTREAVRGQHTRDASPRMDGELVKLPRVAWNLQFCCCMYCFWNKQTIFVGGPLLFCWQNTQGFCCIGTFWWGDGILMDLSVMIYLYTFFTSELHLHPSCQYFLQTARNGMHHPQIDLHHWSLNMFPKQTPATPWGSSSSSHENPRRISSHQISCPKKRAVRIYVYSPSRQRV